MITDLAQVTEGRLCWPESKPRVAQRINGRFGGHSIDSAIGEIPQERMRQLNEAIAAARKEKGQAA